MVTTTRENRKRISKSAQDAPDRKPGGPLERMNSLEDCMASLTGSEFKVAFILSQASKPDGISWPSIAYIMEKTGLCKPTVYRAIRGLEAKGVGVIIESGKRVWTSNTYKLLAADDGWGVVENEIIDSQKLESDSQNVAPELQKLTRDSQKFTTNPKRNPEGNPKGNPFGREQPSGPTGPAVVPGVCECGSPTWADRSECLTCTVEAKWKNGLDRQWEHNITYDHALTWYQKNPDALELPLPASSPWSPTPSQPVSLFHGNTWSRRSESSKARSITLGR